MFIPDYDMVWVAAEKIDEADDGVFTFLVTDEEVVNAESNASPQYRKLSNRDLPNGTKYFPLQARNNAIHPLRMHTLICL